MRKREKRKKKLGLGGMTEDPFELCRVDTNKYSYAYSEGECEK